MTRFRFRRGTGTSFVIAAVAVSFAAPTSSAASSEPTTFTLKLGSYYTQRDAKAATDAARVYDVAPVVIHENQNAEGGHFEVWAGEYDNFEQLWAKLQAIRQQGANCEFVHSTWYDFKNGAAAIHGDLPDYFTDGLLPIVPAGKPRPLSEPYQSLRGPYFDSESTSPEVLAAMKLYLKALPEEHPVKGRDVITYVRRCIAAGGSSYSSIRPTYTEEKNLLLRVANRETAATDAERNQARDLVARMLHYYDRDYISAFRAYNQMIREDDAALNEAAVARHRVSMAGAVLEYRKESGFPSDETQAVLDDLWKQNIIVQEDYLTTDSEDAKAVRSATSRIGLMINMNYMDQGQWSEAETVITSLIAMYSGIPDCRGPMAEAWTQLCGIYSETGRYEKIDEAASNAMEIAREIGKPIFGDKNRDIIWKAYTWQYNAAVRTRNERRWKEIEKAMRTEFPELTLKYLGPTRKTD